MKIKTSHKIIILLLGISSIIYILNDIRDVQTNKILSIKLSLMKDNVESLRQVHSEIDNIYELDIFIEFLRTKDDKLIKSFIVENKSARKIRIDDRNRQEYHSNSISEYVQYSRENFELVIWKWLFVLMDHNKEIIYIGHIKQLV